MNFKFNTLGRHILVEYYNCNSAKLADPTFIEAHMVEAAIRAKATVVTSDFHHFKPYGVSGAVIISESHLTIHTWPEYGYAAVDLFTCGDIDPWLGFDFLEKVFEAERSESIEIPRGMTDKIRKYSPVPLNEITYKPMDKISKVQILEGV